MSKKVLKKTILLFAVAIIFLTSCAVVSKYSHKEKETLLLNHLNKWKNFRLNGIIEVNYQIFSFRKNIQIKKTGNLFRADIFDTGLLGLSPSPFLTAYYDSLLTLKLPGNESLVVIPQNKLLHDFPYINYLLDFQLLAQHKDKIIKNHRIELDDLTIYFSNQMEISRVDRADKNYSLVLKYGKELQEIIFLAENKTVADIIIDKISFSEVNFKKIEPDFNLR